MTNSDNKISPTTKTLRIFGYIWAFIFVLFASGEHQSPVLLVIATIFFISASFFPTIYVKSRIFDLWLKFGDFAGKINSKIIIFALFFAIFTPIGLILRLFKKDLLNKKLDKASITYFKKRTEDSSDMRNQF